MAKSILISCGARLAPFDIQEVRDMMSYDQLELEKLGGYVEKIQKKDPKTGKYKTREVEKKPKTALFVIISDTDSTFNFIVSLLYIQLFDMLCDKAINEFRGRLPVHCRFILDEFANIAKIPDFEKKISTFRSREISAAVILQAQSQLKSIYKEDMDTIIGNMDAKLFLGGSEKSTLKEMEELLGKQTVHMYNTSVTRGNQESHGQNYQKLGRSLMTSDEISIMDGGKCILQVRGARPFFSDKYDIEKHHNYKYLSDFNSKFEFKPAPYLAPYKATRDALLKGVNKANTTVDRIIVKDEPPTVALTPPPNDIAEEENYDESAYAFDENDDVPI